MDRDRILEDRNSWAITESTTTLGASKPGCQRNRPNEKSCLRVPWRTSLRRRTSLGDQLEQYIRFVNWPFDREYLPLGELPKLTPEERQELWDWLAADEFAETDELLPSTKESARAFQSRKPRSSSINALYGRHQPSSRARSRRHRVFHNGSRTRCSVGREICVGFGSMKPRSSPIFRTAERFFNANPTFGALFIAH
jgi:hypothetical protein